MMMMMYMQSVLTLPLGHSGFLKKFRIQSQKMKMKEKMMNFKLSRNPVELAQVLEMYLTRILHERALTLSAESGRLLEKLRLAMNMSAPLRRRRAEERAI